MRFNNIYIQQQLGLLDGMVLIPSFFPLHSHYSNFFDIKRLLSKTFCHFSKKKLYISSISQVFRKVIAWRRFIDIFFFILPAKQKMISFLNILILCHLRFSDRTFNFYANRFHVFSFQFSKVNLLKKYALHLFTLMEIMFCH